MSPVTIFEQLQHYFLTCVCEMVNIGTGVMMGAIIKFEQSGIHLDSVMFFLFKY